MNIILVEPDEIQDNCVRLVDHRAEHIVKVLRSERGDTVKIGQVDDKIGSGTILEIKKKYPFCVELRLQLTDNPPPKPLIDLVLALPRPIMLKRILSQVTALGVGTIHLINANRVEKSFWEASILERQEYRTHLLHGLEQAVDTRLPEVMLHPRFKPFVEDFMPDISDEYGSCICAHPLGTRVLSDVVDSVTDRLLLAIGPEGGWVDYEVEKFQEQQFSCCSIGSRILKVDTAVIALHSRLSALQEFAGWKTESVHV